MLAPEVTELRPAAPPPDAPDDVADIVAMLTAVLRRVRVSGRPLSGTDVTARMLDLVRHAAAPDPLTVGELARRIGVTKATVTELVTRVETRGLVQRVRDDRDRRRVLVVATEQGHARLAASGAASPADDLSRALAGMADDDRAALQRGLAALVAAVGRGEQRGERPRRQQS